MKFYLISPNREILECDSYEAASKLRRQVATVSPGRWLSDGTPPLTEDEYEECGWSILISLTNKERLFNERKLWDQM